MSLAHRTVRNTSILFLARTLARLLVLVVFVIQLRSLGASRYGEFGVAVVLSNLSSIAGDLGVQIVYLREGSRHQQRLQAYLSAALGAKLPLLLVSLLILTVGAGVVHPSLLFLVVPAFALLACTSVANVLRSTFYATGEMRYEAGATLSEAVILLVGTVLVARAHLSISAYLWVYALSYAVTCVYALAIISRRYFRPLLTFDPALSRRLIMLGLPFALVFFMNTIYFRIDVLLLYELRDAQQVGFYQGAYKFLDAVSFVPQTLMNAVFPTLSILHLGQIDSLRVAYTTACRVLASIAMPITVALVFGAGALLGLLHIYSQSVPSLQILGLAVIFMFVNNTFIFGLGAMNRQLDSVLLAGMSIVVNVGLNLILIPLYPRAEGYLGSSWATVITEVFLLVAGYWIVRRRLENSLPWVRQFYPILLSGALMVGVMLSLRGHNVFWVIPLAGIFYLGAMVATGGISMDDIATARQSFGRRLAPVPEDQSDG